MSIKQSKKNQFKTLGPVSDLERHLPSEWWRTLFSSVYLKTDGDVVECENNTVREINKVVEILNPNSVDRILDLCCGQGRHSIELAKRGFKNVFGLDRSRYLIRLAKKRANALDLVINFHEGDARKFRFKENYFSNVIVMGNSFGYFDKEEDDVSVLRAIHRVMIPEGKLVLDITDGDWIRSNYEKRSWEWIDQSHFVCRERTLSNDGQRLVSREVVTHAEKGVIVDQFYAERLYSVNQLIALLENSGFINVNIHGELETESIRNQDLGMMGKRIFVTCNAKKEIKREYFIPIKKAVVLLGDPNLSDQVKPNNCFNEEDIDTVNKLKDALKNLKNYSFSFVDNHRSFFMKLKNEKTDLVFNLCDEGFCNDPFKELHVPAYLEMLDLPYTGSGPSTIAICYNKSLVMALAHSLSIPTPLETYFNPDDQSATLPHTLPAIVKPNYGDGSQGINKNSIVYSPNELISYMRFIQDTYPGRPILIQEYLTGREFSVAVVGNPGMTYKVFPPVEVDFSELPEDLPRILGYESKWETDSPYFSLIKYKEAILDEEVKRKLFDYSNLLFERLGCRDYARFDFRMNADGVLKFLEANPNPGWCWDGKLAMMAAFDGLSYTDLLKLIIDVAEERIANQKNKNNYLEKNTDE